MSDTIASASAPQVDSTDHAADSQRAAIARVTLQLRQTIAAAEGVERQIALARQTACDELRTRLDALQEQRRQMLELEVQRREADAAATVAPAHRQVAPSVDAPATTSLVPVQPPTGSVMVDVDTLARVCAMVVTEVLEQRYGAAAMQPQLPMPMSTAVALPSNVIVVAEPAPVAPQRPSFWRNLLSTDVLLIGVAAAIVAVVLVAWLG